MIYSLDTTQNGLRNPTLKFIEEFHNCPAVWDVSFLAYKETKNKQKKTEELWDKLAFDETSLFPSRFLFLFFSSSVSMPYASATALKRSAMWEITVRCDLTRVCRKEFASVQKAPMERKEGGGWGVGKTNSRSELRK